MNLFALELSALLERHGLTMSVLYTLRAPEGTPAIAPAKVARLQRSLTEDVTAVLGEREISQLGAALGVDRYEEQRLRAALTGEAVRQLLAGRVSGMSALEEGERVVGLLIDEAEDEESLREQLVRSASAVADEQPRPSADVNAATATALDEAAEACEQGELWLSMALAAPDRDRREDLLGMAWTALDRAAQLLAYAPGVAQGSAVQVEWRRTVENALATIRQLRPRG